jgi:sporulation protein YlmC with PRC-barrel domain
MRVDLDAKVRTRDGEDAGTVQRAVVDPRTNEVTEFVVSTGGFLGKDVLVPRGEIERADTDGDAIRLNLSKDELERLPSYAPASYVVPPTGATLPMGYGFPETGYLWPVGLAAATGVGYTPAMGPVGGPAGAAGLGTAAAGYGAGGAGSASAQGGTAAGLQAGGAQVSEASLGKGAMVVDRDGDDVGVVDEVLFDQEGGQLRGFVLRVGGTLRTLFGGGETVEIPASDVEHVAESLIHLRVGKQDLATSRH